MLKIFDIYFFLTVARYSEGTQPYKHFHCHPRIPKMPKTPNAPKPKSIVKVIKKKQTVKAIDKALGNSPSVLDTLANKIEIHQSWEDLYGLYNEISSAMVDVSIKVSQILNQCKDSSVQVPKEVVLASKALYTDLTNMTDDLLKIKSLHANKKGLVKNENDLSLALDIFNKYYLLFDRFKALTFQELLVITDFAMHLDQPIQETQGVVNVQ